MRETGSTAKHLLSIPSANRRPVRKQESMGRIVPKTSYLHATGRLGSMATNSDGYPQPLLKRDHEGSPERSVTGVPTAPRLPFSSIYE